MTLLDTERTSFVGRQDRDGYAIGAGDESIIPRLVEFTVNAAVLIATPGRSGGVVKKRILTGIDLALAAAQLGEARKTGTLSDG